MQIRESVFRVALLFKKFFWPLLIGIFLLVGGYFFSIDSAKAAKDLRNSGIITQATILKRDHIFDLSDTDEYKITYSFRAQSPIDGEWHYFVANKKVTRARYNSIDGCQENKDIRPPIYAQDCERETIGPNNLEILICDDVQLDAVNCEQETIGPDNFEVLVCGDVQPNYPIRNVVGCEDIQIIYHSEDPNLSWILGTEPTSGAVGNVMMVFGFLFLAGSIYKVWYTRDENIERS